MSDRIYRSKKEKSPFTSVDNVIIDRGDMSLAALGLYIYLKKLPIDWVIYKKEIMTHFTNGRYAFETAWDELEKLGYIVGADLLRASGKFKGRDYIFYPLLDADEKKIADYYTGAGNQHRIRNSPMQETNITDAGFSLFTDAENLQLQKTDILQRKNIQNITAYAVCVDFWLKEFHPDWTFSPTHGKTLKQLISKIKTLLVAKGRSADDTEIGNFFKHMCLSLPEFFKDKDLPTINSKFNEIIEQIKNSKNGNGTSKSESKYRN